MSNIGQVLYLPDFFNAGFGKIPALLLTSRAENGTMKEKQLRGITYDFQNSISPAGFCPVRLV